VKYGKIMEYSTVFSSGKYNVRNMGFELCFWFLDSINQSGTGNKWEDL
jgi:hypothetical protein